MGEVTGTTANDLIHVAGDSLTGLAGLLDIALATSGDESLYGFGGNDVVRGGAGVDHLYGGEGNDLLVLQSPQDMAVGESYFGGNGYDELMGTGMTEAVSLEGSGLLGVEALLGFGAGISLKISQLTQFTYLDTGTIHILTGGTIGLTDVDVRTRRIELSDLGNVITLSSDPVVGARRGGFQGLVLGGEGDDSITVQKTRLRDNDGGPRVILDGAAGNDTLTVWERKSVLFGGAGDDSLSGGVQAQRIEGGAGDDVVSYDARATDCVLLGGSGQDSLTASSDFGTIDLSDQILRGFEKMYFGSDVILTRQQLVQFEYIRNIMTTTMSDSGVLHLRDLNFFEFRLQLADGDDIFTITTRSFSALALIQGGDGNDRMTVLDGATRAKGPWGWLFGEGGDDTLTGSQDRDVLQAARGMMC